MASIIFENIPLWPKLVPAYVFTVIIKQRYLGYKTLYMMAGYLYWLCIVKS